MIEQLHSRATIDPFAITLARGDETHFIEHVTHNLFRNMSGILEDKFGSEALVATAGLPDLRAYPDNVKRYAWVAGRQIGPGSVELKLDLVVMTMEDYRGLLRRAENGDDRRDAQVASKAKEQGKREEKARIKGKLTKAVESLVE